MTSTIDIVILWIVKIGSAAMLLIGFGIGVCWLIEQLWEWLCKRNSLFYAVSWHWFNTRGKVKPDDKALIKTMHNQVRALREQNDSLLARTEKSKKHPEFVEGPILTDDSDGW